MLDLVLFDMDGVLADTEPLHHRATERVLAADGLRIAPDTFREFLGSTDRRMFEVLRERHALMGSVDDYVARKERALFELLAGGLLPNPGVCELLLHLQMNGIPAVVASSSGLPVIEAIVGALGLRRSFRALYSVSMAGRPKPAPDVFLHAAAAEGADPARCLVIEDSPAGIAAGKAAGMRVIALRTEWTRGLDLGSPDRVVDSLLHVDPEALGGGAVEAWESVPEELP